MDGVSFAPRLSLHLLVPLALSLMLQDLRGLVKVRGDLFLFLVGVRITVLYQAGMYRILRF